ncbi:MAG: hypothetical protein ACI8RZ_000933 [Myxococcota bacterium]|jgi:hypothetical protein
MSVLIIIPIVLILLGVMLYAQHQAAEMERHWRAIAAERGLEWLPGGWFTTPKLIGKQGDYGVEVGIENRSHGKSTTPYTTVRARPTRPLPRELRLTQEGFTATFGKLFGGQDILIGDAFLDSKLRIRSADEAATKALFREPTLRRAVGALANGCTYSRLENTEVILEQQGKLSVGVDRMLDDVLQLVAALDGAPLAPWQAVSSRLSLNLIDQGSRANLSGTHRGQRVVLSVNLAARQTIIDVPITGLPSGLSITAGKKSDAIRLGDPVLDGMVSATGRNPDAIRTLLRDDDLRGELLSVIHAWPGSAVTPRGVRLIMPGAAAEGLDARLEEATTLAATLTRRVEATSRPAAAVRQPT